MIVYSDRDERADVRRELRRLHALADALAAARAPAHSDATELLIDFGRLEAGVADALCPDADDDTPVTRAFREVSLALGGGFVRSWRGGGGAPDFAAAAGGFGRLGSLPLPEHVRVRVPEGYAFYSLYPETYAAAAERFAREVRPRGAVCIGVRSIGTSLSAVVSGALGAAGCPVESFTVRPRGHPFERRLVLADGLAERLRARRGWHFLVVDEGPGLSGSSFAGVAEALSALGIADDHVILFPSWDADPGGLRSERARERWGRHRRFVGSFEEVWTGSGRLADAVPGHRLEDWSAGAWRAHFFADPAAYPAVQPQHERRKYLARADEDGRPAQLLKFAGLGRYGRERLETARRLAEAGFGPPALGVENGFLRMGFVDGQPVTGESLDAALLDRAAEYLAWRRRALPAGESVPFDALLRMIEVNTAEGLGDAWAARLGGLRRFFAAVRGGETVAVDGRMLPHEWLRTPGGGYVKTDGVDHHADHFFPGCQDVAWDVAGFAAEFGLDNAALTHVCARCAALSGDGSLAARLPFYRIAYPAYRLGYATMAAGALGDSPDGRRMAALGARYAGALQAALARAEAAGATRTP